MHLVKYSYIPNHRTSQATPLKKMTIVMTKKIDMVEYNLKIFIKIYRLTHNDQSLTTNNQLVTHLKY
jgi:hypothetical protein